MNTTPSHPRLADALAEIADRYGIDTAGLTDAQVLSLGFDAGCEDQDEGRAARYDELASDAAAGSPPLHVATWDETARHAGNLAGVVRLLIGGCDTGTVSRSESGWTAQVTGEAAQTVHATTGDAITAVVRSPRARRLGWRAASRMHFSLAASQALAARGGRA